MANFDWATVKAVLMEIVKYFKAVFAYWEEQNA